MKFCDYVYKRVDVEAVKDFFEKSIASINGADDVKVLISLIKDINLYRDEISSMITICSIRHSINTNDEFYDKENEFYDEYGPVISSLETKFFKSILESKFRNEIENEFGSHWIKLLELQQKTFSDEIIEDLTMENKLVSKYSKILASAQIEFDGKINNLSQMGVYQQSTDRFIRKNAALKIVEFLEPLENELNEIYDSLVKVRTKMAQKLGYKNYVELGYARLSRTDYNSEMVANYRKQVYDSLVPLCKDIISSQMERINVKDFKFYDLGLQFLDGNPKPKGNSAELLSIAQNMYSCMSEETKEFFDYMVENELLDLETKPGKRGGGYCTYIPKYNAPFIFSNFNGTSGDVDVLTHEAGHAFQVYTAAKSVRNPDLYFPTMDSCEIHSMSMEFFSYPWIGDFFKEDEKKYKQNHLSGALTFIPYGVAVDEFQHYVYENYDCAIIDRKNKWREIEKKYTPYKDYDGVEYYERGNLWLRQHHIFSSPFYYIDYTLAQVCALKFYLLDNENHEKAWEKYYKLCKLGGTKSFLNLLKAVDLVNPFVPGTIDKIVSEITPILNRIIQE